MIAADFTQIRKELMEPKPTFGDLAALKKSEPVKAKISRAEEKQQLWDIRAELNIFVPEVTKRLLMMIFNENTEDKDRLKCIELFYNRMYGKPLERMEIGTPDNAEDMSAKEIQARILSIIDSIPANNKKYHLKALTKEGKTDNAL